MNAQTSPYSMISKKGLNDYMLYNSTLAYSQGFRHGVEATLKFYQSPSVEPGKITHESIDNRLALAKGQIKDLFEQRHGETVDYLDLVEALGLPLTIVVDACEELEREGKIAAVD